MESRILFNQATLNKARKEEKDILRLERRIIELGEHVELERSNRIEFNQLKEFLLTSHESHANSQRIFYDKELKFHETTLKVIILLKRE